MRIAYPDAFSGISGDMTVGALLDAGAPAEPLIDAPSPSCRWTGPTFARNSKPSVPSRPRTSSTKGSEARIALYAFGTSTTIRVPG